MTGGENCQDFQKAANIQFLSLDNSFRGMFSLQNLLYTGDLCTFFHLCLLFIHREKEKGKEEEGERNREKKRKRAYLLVLFATKRIF